MQYMIMNYVPEADDEGVEHADMNAWQAYTMAMVDAGVMKSGNALKPSGTATTLRVRDGRRDIQDGPYAESKEQLGGYYVIEAPDLDSALEWAARNPAAAYGVIEVRPIMTY